MFPYNFLNKVHPCSSKNTNVNPPIPSANAPKDAAPKPPLPKVTKKASKGVQSVQVSSSEVLFKLHYKLSYSAFVLWNVH